MSIFLIVDSEVLKKNPNKDKTLNLIELMKIISDNKIKKFKSAILSDLESYPEEFLDFLRNHFIIYKERNFIDSTFIKDVFLMYYLEVQRSNNDRFVYLTNNDKFIEVNKILKKESETDRKPLTLELYFWKDLVSKRLIKSVDRFIPLESIEKVNPLEFIDEELPEVDLSGIPDYDDFPDNIIEGN